MALIKCSECKKEINKDVKICPNCGVKIKKSKEKKETLKDKKHKNKIPFVIGIIVIVVAIIGVICFMITSNSNSIQKQFDKLLNSNQIETIFFERKGVSESEEFKQLLDTDLKEQGITYTTIDITNATNEDLEYFKEKLKLSSDGFDVYIAIINGSENLAMLNYKDYDKTMFWFANKGLLNDNQIVLNEYHYNLGKQAFENGNLGAAKEHLEKVINYKDEKEILSNKRFYLVGNEYTYTNGNESLSGRHLDISFKYYGGSDYSEDWIYTFVWDCQLPYGCLYSNGESNSFDAKMISDNEILIRKFHASDSVPFDNSLKIEILSETQIKLGYNGKYYTLTKKN